MGEKLLKNPAMLAAVQELAELEAAIQAGQSAVKRGEKPLPLAKWAKDGKCCWGRGWNTQIMGNQRYVKVCNCVMRRIRKLKASITLI